MTRMKALILGTLASVMILGSTIVLASEAPTSDTTTVDPGTTTVEIAPGPAPKRGGGGSGKALKK